MATAETVMAVYSDGGALDGARGQGTGKPDETERLMSGLGRGRRKSARLATRRRPTPQYVAKLKAQLEEWNAQLEQLETKAQNAKAEAQSEYEDQLAALRHRRDEAYQKLEELTQASGDAWEEFRQGCDNAFTALKEGVEKAWAHFK